MTKLAILEEPRTFPPRKFLLIIWLTTLAIAIYGLIATPGTKGAMYVWLAIGAIAFWQIWTLRWVQVDNDGIRVRNIFQRGRELLWSDVRRFHEEEVRLNKGIYTVILISNEPPPESQRLIRIKLTDDQVNFQMLRDIVREMAPRS